MTELKPCPFCGGREMRIAANYLGRNSIMCLSCTILFFGRDDTDSRNIDELIEAWNRRATDIDKASTVDAVPVVRCGNCINSKDGYTCFIGRGSAFNGNATFPNSYCDNGERRTDEKDRTV